uniref:Uncharacterized protein n=1 Tax=Rhizoctonia solani TaxID=456999 RepID=N0ABY0_9AGAM|nr:hypothetical protein RSOL_m01290 [Rhizoctonia solani]AGK45441.1 hypothetical protein RSOL_m01290 [Rhizoctonia solani]
MIFWCVNLYGPYSFSCTVLNKFRIYLGIENPATIGSCKHDRRLRQKRPSHGRLGATLWGRTAAAFSHVAS